MTESTSWTIGSTSRKEKELKFSLRRAQLRKGAKIHTALKVKKAKVIVLRATK